MINTLGHRTVILSLICIILPIYLSQVYINPSHSWLNSPNLPIFEKLFSLRVRPLLNLKSILSRTSKSTPMSTATPFKLIPRPSEERGNADHGWLKTFHTFDFASYQSSGHDHLGPLRVINEDRVAPHTGFGTHSHREFEIFSYVVSGELRHKDSMGNTEILKRGDVQLTSAGTGISHSEETHGEKQVHFLQIWSIPSVSKLVPKYFTRHFTDKDKTNKFIKVVAPITSSVSPTREGTGPAPVHSPLTLSAALISPSTTLTHTFPANTPQGYIHIIQTSGYNTKKSQGASIRVKGMGIDGEEVVLREGDGVYVHKQPDNVVDVTFENVGDRVAEVLVFDLGL